MLIGYQRKFEVMLIQILLKLDKYKLRANKAEDINTQSFMYLLITYNRFWHNPNIKNVEWLYLIVLKCINFRFSQNF